MIIQSWYIIPAAFILALVLGDPEFLPHPIRWMGKSITTLEPGFRNFSAPLSVSGAFFSLFLILCTWGLSFIILKSARIIHPAVGICTEILMIYYCISAGCLEKYVMDVYLALKKNRLSDAKKKVARIVGRDVDPLTEQGVIRASVETVAENLVDGFISPLFFAALGGAPLAMAYKMVNTLDSMIGYKNERYRDFGKTAARIDDAANFIPARISVFVIALASKILSGNGSIALETGVKEGKNHRSPNSGYSEAAFAGALKVRLGGPGFYGGQMVWKPFIGRQFGNVNSNHIQKACDLMIFSAVLWAAMLTATTAFF
jgi:adenosylcobinamide-phosphate synthase